MAGPDGRARPLCTMVFSNSIMQALQQQTVGQEYAVAALTRAITLALSGKNNRNGALCVLLFVGTPGSGKTHMARVLARALLGNERKLIVVNCQQFEQRPDLLPAFESQLAIEFWQSQMAPPFGPQPFRIIVFENIDKAPVLLRDHLATALDRGAVYMRGAVFSLRNTFVIF
ncbi:MAG TPA: AAA family ATPase, partial [Blastocatellia bacterium]|nr:AAA family ATPase [Blastocatellia bacterium]